MIGIDIGSRFIKVCQVVEEKHGRYRIAAATRVLNPGTGEKLDIAGVSEKLRVLSRDVSFDDRATAISIGSSQTLARNFVFPLLPDEELKGAVKLETEQSIFSDINGMYVDYQVLSQLDKDKLDVLFIGAPRDTIDAQISATSAAGFDVSVVDIDNLALANSYLTFNPEAPKATVVLLNIGHTTTNISVIDCGKLRFVRNVNVGGKQISQEIAQMYEVQFAVAEDLKKHPELWPSLGLNIKNVLRKSMPELLESIYRSIEYCMSRKKIINIDKILLTGGSSYLQGMDEFISDVLGITTESWNPLDKMDLTAAAKRDLGRFLTVALGLAIRKDPNA